MKKFSAAVLALILIAFGYALIQPKEYSVERSLVMKKPMAQVFPMVADFKNWKEWSPWVKSDPNMLLAYGETSTGVGGKQEWVSKELGSGYQIIQEFEPEKRIAHKLVFTEPFQAESINEFLFEAVNDQETKVTWKMSAQNKDLVARFFYGAMRFDKTLGKAFEAGLVNIETAIK